MRAMRQLPVQKMPVTFTPAEAVVLLERVCTRFSEMVWSLSREDWLIPSTDVEEKRLALALVVERLRTVLPVRVLCPSEVTIPQICPPMAVPA